ncbi:hypothetical protein ACFTWH_04735 [Streptomyces sp. NPDC057011]|uniref:hypothetical protein n=1 Tax=unclassified Streptomyces TaxID=2593676 RepID=UPI00362F4CD9
MPKNHEIPTGPGGSDEDKWNALREEYSGWGAMPQEPAPPAARPRRAWPLNTALALLAAGSAFVVLTLMDTSPDTKAPAPAPARAASAAPSPSPSKNTLDTRPMIPLGDVFPAEVKGASGATFTRLGSVVLESCTEADSIGPRLAALIEDSAGCVGEQVALYKDAQDNQFNLAVFTMKDPKDAVMLTTELAMAFNDYQVAVQGPPPGSGLKTLPADSGLVQAFTGHGRVMVVAMGQWSDGRTADFQQLVDRMGPLQGAVSKKVGDYEGTR